MSSDPSDALSRLALPDTTVAQLFQRARSAIVLTDPRTEDNPIIACNAAFLELTGYAEGEVIGRNCRFLQGSGTDQGLAARIGACIGREQTGQFEILNYRKDGSTFWNALHIGPIYGEDGRLQYYFGSQYDITKVVEARRVQEREHRQLTHALQAARAIGTFDWEVPEDRLAVDEGFAQAFGLDPSAAAEGLPIEAFYKHVDPADLDRLRDAVDEAIRTGDHFECEYGVQGTDRHRWLLGRGRCLHDDRGRPTRFSGVVVDITHRKETEDALRDALDHAEVLQKEVDHRIKNLFAIVPAIVNMSARGASNASALAGAVQQRIGALARAHSLTIGASNAQGGVEIGALVRAVLDPYTDERMPFDLAGAPVRVEQRDASVVALALHELATNAVKYGALSNADGRVRVEWTMGEGAADAHGDADFRAAGRRTLSLDWQESGGPVIAAPPERQGSGTRLIEQLARGMGGQIRRHWDPDGVRIRLELPATFLPSLARADETAPGDD